MLYISKFKHCIFDFDGVIIDSERLKFKNLKDILKKYDFDLKDDYFFDFVGKKRAYFIKELKNKNLNFHLDEIMREVHERDFDLSNYNLIPGLVDFLVFLNKSDISSHIATGSSEGFVVKVLETFNIKKYFSHIITGDQVKESKPSSKVYLSVLEKINNESAFVIEDSSAGIMSAKGAGLFVVSFIEHEKSDLFVSDFFELLNKLAR